MAIKTSDYVNEFFARGIVLKIDWKPRAGRVLQLLVKERRTTLRLNITLEPGVGKNLSPKDRVVVKGYIKAFDYYNEVSGKNIYVLFLAGSEVEKEQTELSKRFGKRYGGFYPEPVFRSFISGPIVEVTQPLKNGWAKLKIKTCGGGQDLRPCYVEVRYFTGNRLPFFDYVAGDVVCVRLGAYTPEKKMQNGKSILFQNLLVEDIDYMEKLPRESEKAVQTAVDLGLPEAHTISGDLSFEQLLSMAARQEVENEEYADDKDLMGNSDSE